MTTSFESVAAVREVLRAFNEGYAKAASFLFLRQIIAKAFAGRGGNALTDARAGFC